jgi:thioredoxin-dependent peroxiredoxin
MTIRLRDFRGQPVVLSFLRGFGWPFCQRHLGELRASFEQIRTAGAVVLTIAPSPVDEVRAATLSLELPFPCLADPDRTAFKQSEVGSSAWSLGQRPAVFLIGRDGRVDRGWKGRQQWEIPSVGEILAALERVGTDARSQPL